MSSPHPHGVGRRRQKRAMFSFDQVPRRPQRSARAICRTLRLHEQVAPRQLPHNTFQNTSRMSLPHPPRCRAAGAHQPADPTRYLLGSAGGRYYKPGLTARHLRRGLEFSCEGNAYSIHVSSRFPSRNRARASKSHSPQLTVRSPVNGGSCRSSVPSCGRIYSCQCLEAIHNSSPVSCGAF